jgi:hypothetical protein
VFWWRQKEVEEIHENDRLRRQMSGPTSILACSAVVVITLNNYASVRGTQKRREVKGGTKVEQIHEVRDRNTETRRKEL